jgi:hypothetical protein
MSRRKEVMRIGDDNLFEIGCREYLLSWLVPVLIHVSHRRGVPIHRQFEYDTHP